MALDPRYIPAFELQEVLFDKYTGAPLAGGIVTTYKDAARTQYKPLYMISGSPPNYTYIPLPNPIVLSSIGTFQDLSGNDIIPYYYPYDIGGNVEQYYITVYSASGSLQYTREARPNVFATSSSSAIEQKNYVPNGQFLIHNDLLADPVGGYILGQVRTDVTEIAPGGWFFERSAAATSTDHVIFQRYSAYTINPSASPRYAARISCTIVGTSSYKYLSLRFRDVNKFASSSQYYTFSMSGENNSGGTLSLPVTLYKNFGTGGSAPVPTTIGTVLLSGTPQQFSLSFIFGDNSAYTIGNNDDDYLELRIGLPTGSIFDVTFTDFLLASGQLLISQYPIETEDDNLYKSGPGSLPVPLSNGMDLALPISYRRTGYFIDHSPVGFVFPTVTKTAPYGYLLCDGSQYLTNGISPDGIPYARLQAAIWDSTRLVPAFGTGIPFVIIYGSTPTSLVIFANDFGLTTALSDGTIPTGFSFSTISPGSPSTYFEGQIAGILAAAGITAGAWFNFHTPAGAAWYVWFKKDGLGSDPAVVGATGIEVDITTGETATQVGAAIQTAVNMKYFAVPDLLGEFIRGWANGSATDPDRASRTDVHGQVIGDFIGTYQADSFLNHNHVYGAENNDCQGAAFSGRHPVGVYNDAFTYVTSSVGGNETRPKNIYLNYVIKY